MNYTVYISHGSCRYNINTQNVDKTILTLADNWQVILRILFTGGQSVYFEMKGAKELLSWTKYVPFIKVQGGAKYQQGGPIPPPPTHTHTHINTALINNIHNVTYTYSPILLHVTVTRIVQVSRLLTLDVNIRMC